jgi:hypothetical protein
MVPKPLPLSLTCQHPGSKTTKAKDSKHRAKVPIFSTERKRKLKLWNHYRIRATKNAFVTFLKGL